MCQDFKDFERLPHGLLCKLYYLHDTRVDDELSSAKVQGIYRISGVLPFITILTILIFCCYLINCCLQSSDCSPGSAEERQIWSSSKLGTKPTINRVQFKQLPNLGLYKVPQNRNNLLASPWIHTEMSLTFIIFHRQNFCSFIWFHQVS